MSITDTHRNNPPPTPTHTYLARELHLVLPPPLPTLVAQPLGVCALVRIARGVVFRRPAWGAVAHLPVTQTHRLRHRHTDTKTQTHRHTETQAHRHTGTDTDTQTHRHTGTQTHKHTDIPPPSPPTHTAGGRAPG